MQNGTRVVLLTPDRERGKTGEVVGVVADSVRVRLDDESKPVFYPAHFVRPVE